MFRDLQTLISALLVRSVTVAVQLLLFIAVAAAAVVVVVVVNSLR